MHGRSLLCVAMIWFSATAACAQTEAPPAKPAIPTEGFWPTKLMLDRMLARMAEELSFQYEFDADQTERTRELFRDVVPKFLDENRAELQTLTNEFLETIFHDEPPTPEAVANWAQRAIPVFERLTGFADTLTGQMREYMNDEQAQRLDGEVAAFHAGAGFATRKLQSWAAGEYDPESEWTRPGPERRQHEREQRRAMQAEMRAAREAQAAADAVEADARNGRPTTGVKPASQPDDEWSRYTTEFIRRYELNDEQQQKAQRVLRSKQDERDRYLTSKGEELERVTKLAKDAQTDEEKAAAKEAARKLDAPVDRMFQQLKDRLDALPTRAQRQAAAKRDMEKPTTDAKPTASSPASNPPTP